MASGREFKIASPEATEAGVKIQGEGSLFEEQIALIGTTVQNCSVAWVGTDYNEFEVQTQNATQELSVLREFFDTYGAEIIKFAQDSEAAQEAVSKYIKSHQ